MKIRKTYVIYLNRMLGEATFGNKKYGRRISRTTIGEIYYCNFCDLKYNLDILKKKNYIILKSRE